jgi:CheY-like chemotaxis protein
MTMKSNDPIIVVDDDLDDQFLVKKVCENLHISRDITFFDDGRDVLKYLRSTAENPFLILCDINMPAMSGLDLRREINKDDFLRVKSIPFVFFSTAASPAQLREAYLLTVQGFFIKETTMERIEKTLKLIFDYWEICKHPNSFR